MDQAEGYVRIATKAIRYIETRKELLKWWEDEKSNREINGVTEAYERRLISACRHHLEVIAQRSKTSEMMPMRKKRG